MIINKTFIVILFCFIGFGEVDGGWQAHKNEIRIKEHYE